ncbi:ATP-dependent DNA helicase [Paenibacillus sonchi]|nr:ATP-dependent DNA helicase [Paenibacillus sonchi]
MKGMEKPLIDAIFRIFNNYKSYGLKDRIGQQDMSLDIAYAYLNGENAMIEAGVGIGKSYGYLIPSLYINFMVNQPIIIATSSIQLSEQIHKDLRRIANRLGFVKIRSVVGKGMGQYACRHRATELFDPKDKTESTLSTIIQGIMDMEFHERSDIQGGVNDSEWSKVCVNNCTFERCFYKNICSFYDMRTKINARVGDIDFIIVNQDLLIRDLIKKKESSKGLITERTALIVIDEAHNLESKVRDARTVEFTLRSACRILDNTLQILIKHTGDRSLFSRFKFLKECCDYVFKQVEKDLRCMAKQDNDRIKVSEMKKISYDRISQYLRDTNIGLSIITTREDREVDNAIEEINELIDLFDILAGVEENYIIWASNSKRVATISICPKEISQLLRYSLFNGTTPVVLTSATLCQGGDKLDEQYAYMTETLGYIGEYMDRQVSPFDYDNHAMLYIADCIPYYNHENKEAYLEAAYKELIKLCDLTQGRTLVLFSAKEDMKCIFEKLSNEQLSWSLHVQKEGSSQDEVIEEFRANKGVLLGTGVFWEGVNIEGPDLSQVIIFRLPFPVPADPVYEYKASTSKDPQKEIFLPDMLIRLRQGTGRLIRSESDLGVLSILDSRLCTAANRDYRDTVLDALPFKNVTEDFSALQRFVEENGIQMTA